MLDPLMIDGRALDSAAEEIVAMLIDIAQCGVTLIDLDEKRSHGRMSSYWFSYSTATEDLAATVLDRAYRQGRLCVRINRRWILRVGGRGTRTTDDGGTVAFARAQPLSIESEALAEKGAELLARFLPTTSDFSDVLPPTGGGGGGSGSAELGIPVWWARKARN